MDEIFWADEKIGDLPFIFFAVVAGKKARLYAINRNKQVKKLTKEYAIIHYSVFVLDSNTYKVIVGKILIKRFSKFKKRLRLRNR